MHQHREGVHAHVRRDVDGRKMIELLKRDDLSANVLSFIHRPQHNTNSENIKLNYPAGFAEKDTNDSGVATAVSVVYVTMSPTFSGSVLGYVTASADSSSAAAATDAGIAAAAVTTATSSSAQVIVPAAVSSTSSPVAAPILSSSSSQGSSAAAITLTSTTTAALTTHSLGTPLATTQTSSGSTATAVSIASTQQDVSVSQQQSTGMTDGAKAGLAIGIILALALAAGLVFFCWKRAKKDNSHEELNEKSASNEKRSSLFGGAATAAKKRGSVDSDKSFGTVHNTATAPRLSLRPVTQFLPTFGEKRKSGNLLGAAPEMSEKNSAWERRPQNGENPFSDATARPAEKQTNPFEEGDGRSIHSNHSGDGSEPKSATVGTAAAVAIAGKDAAPAQRGSNNVHRVQLDFKPSMDDELELKSGQLVRMLHEYDDGWALCIRMDRSQQGVAPRTCLSKTPVKPRGPPPGGRISPQSNMRGPPPPQGARPMTPQQQQQSPGVARKPVPGQAM